MMPPLFAPVSLRSTARESARKVTWLELFFDLIFVAAVSQVAAPLRENYSLLGLVRLAPLLLLIWLAWTGQTAYATRFDTDDVAQRLLTLGQMFAVAAMAANARDALDSRSSAGFAAAYGALRLLLVAQYARARHVPGARPLVARYAAGHGVAAIIWIASAGLPAPARFVAWAVAFAIDLGTPWTAVPHSVHAPPDAAHLPERFGLFTLILLGESVVAVMHGMESQEDWPPEAALSALLGMGALFLVWWWYFDGVGAVSERHVRSHRDAVRFHLWSYAHFPLCLGIVVMGVGIERLVIAAAHTTVAPVETMLLIGAAVLVMAAMGIIASTGDRRPATLTRMSIAMGAALAVLIVGLRLPPVPPLSLMIGVTLVLSAQLIVALRDHRHRHA